MKTVNVLLSELEYSSLGLEDTTITWKELVKIIEQKYYKKTLQKSIRLAEKNNLSSMTMDEINNEIKSSRNAKSNS